MGCDLWATVFISVSVFGVYEEGRTSVECTTKVKRVATPGPWGPTGPSGHIVHLKQNPAMQPSPPPCRADKMQYRASRFIQTPCAALMCVFNQTAEHTLHSQTSQSVQFAMPFQDSNYPEDEYKDGRVQPSISAWRIQPTLLSVWCAIQLHTIQIKALKPQYSALWYLRIRSIS